MRVEIPRILTAPSGARDFTRVTLFCRAPGSLDAISAASGMEALAVMIPGFEKAGIGFAPDRVELFNGTNRVGIVLASRPGELELNLHLESVTAEPLDTIALWPAIGGLFYRLFSIMPEFVPNVPDSGHEVRILNKLVGGIWNPVSA